MNPRMTLSTARDGAPEPRPTATVLPMTPTAARRFRRDAASQGEPLGRILFFTGVRYERMPETQAEPAIPQRRRS